MEKQLIISISREFGSGGHVIARMLSERYGLPMYDRNLLEEISKQKCLDSSTLYKYDEAKRNKLLSRTVRGYSSSPEDNVAYMQFDFLKEKAKSGESFVVLGRCAESILKDFDGLISIFVTGDLESRIRRTMERENLTYDQAKSKVAKHDKTRKAYHNNYSEGKWGDSRFYDMCINSSVVGVEDTCATIADFIDRKIKADNK